MAEQEPTPERRAKPLPPLDTIQIPDEEYFGEEILKESRGLNN